MKIFHLISNLQYAGRTKHLALLCRALPRVQFQPHVVVLNDSNTLESAASVAALGLAEVPVHFLGRSHRFDPLSLWKLRALLGSQAPNLIHAWDHSALWRLGLARGSAAPMIAANVLPPMGKGQPTFLERWLLKRPARIVARSQAETARYRSAGVSAHKIAFIPPATDITLPSASEKGDLPEGRFILCAGRIVHEKGFRDAIWALDMLIQLFPDVKLVLAGDGPARPELEYFTDRTQLRPHVRFLGTRHDLVDVLGRAALVWVPSQTDTGLGFALEALAAAKPVIATNQPGMRAFLHNGETGYLVAPGDKVAMARHTRELLRNPDLCRRLGAAGRDSAKGFTSDRYVGRFADLYSEVARHARDT